MKTEHTPEPWRIGTPPPNGEQTIGNEKGLMVAVATTGHGVSSRANARRIVACVNACAGLPTEFVEQFDVAGAFQAVHDLEQQRDDLLKAAEAIEIAAEECLDFDECTAMLVPIDTYRKLMEAIPA